MAEKQSLQIVHHGNNDRGSHCEEANCTERHRISPGEQKSLEHNHPPCCEPTNDDDDDDNFFYIFILELLMKHVADPY